MGQKWSQKPLSLEGRYSGFPSTLFLHLKMLVLNNQATSPQRSRSPSQVPETNLSWEHLHPTSWEPQHYIPPSRDPTTASHQLGTPPLHPTIQGPHHWLFHLPRAGFEWAWEGRVGAETQDSECIQPYSSPLEPIPIWKCLQSPLQQDWWPQG